MENSVDKICLKFGGEKELNRYTFKTKVGTLYVTDLADNTFIPMMFDRDFNRDEFVRVSHDNTVGEHSFKYNLHSSDKTFNLGRLEQRLDFINRNFIQN